MIMTFYRRWLLILGILSYMVFPCTASGQQKQQDHGITFHIDAKTDVCTNSKLHLKATVTNRSSSDITVERNLWQYLTEKALDQNSATVVASNFEIKVPIMRGTNAENTSRDADLVKLFPGMRYSMRITIDIETDDFYREPGEYSIRLLLPLRKPRDKDIFSNEFTFIVDQCSKK